MMAGIRFPNTEALVTTQTHGPGALSSGSGDLSLLLGRRLKGQLGVVETGTGSTAMVASPTCRSGVPTESWNNGLLSSCRCDSGTGGLVPEHGGGRGGPVGVLTLGLRVRPGLRRSSWRRRSGRGAWVARALPPTVLVAPRARGRPVGLVMEPGASGSGASKGRPGDRSRSFSCQGGRVTYCVVAFLHLSCSSVSARPETAFSPV